jgi:alpha-D-xyloside xylohydrolase
MQASMIYYDKLRYRLLPYIYTLAADTTLQGGSIMRGLVMDFAADRRTWNIADEYLFGREFLVAPVTAFQARSRKVYLPAGADWYDFNDGAYLKGGQTIDAAAPYERMPLFVRAGSIIPTGPEIMNTSEQPDGPIMLHVFTGADGQFSLYGDDGVSEAYARGKYTRVPVRWDQASRTLTIGARAGSYDGMPARRAIAVRFYTPGKAVAPSFDEAGAISLSYEGQPLSVKQP